MVVALISNWNIFAAPHPHNHNHSPYPHWFTWTIFPFSAKKGGQTITCLKMHISSSSYTNILYSLSTPLTHPHLPQHCILAKTSGRISSIFYTKSIFEQIKKHPKITLYPHLTSIQPSTPVLPPKTPPSLFPYVFIYGNNRPPIYSIDRSPKLSLNR
jgi:hypothetical protein